MTMYLVISRYIKYSLYNNSRNLFKTLNFLIVITVRVTVGSLYFLNDSSCMPTFSGL